MGFRGDLASVWGISSEDIAYAALLGYKRDCVHGVPNTANLSGNKGLGKMPGHCQRSHVGTLAHFQLSTDSQPLQFELPAGGRKAGVCVNGEEGSETRKVLRALGARLEAPQPQEGAEQIDH